MDLGLGKHRTVAGNGDVHRFGDLAAAPIGEAVHRRDDRLGESLEPRRHGLAAPHELADRDIGSGVHAPRKLRDIATCRERPPTGAGQDDGLDRAVGFDGVK
jgi:hypothetical protein